MTQTQLASMFMGKPIELDDDLIDGSTGEGVLNKIIITHGQSNDILDEITARNIIDDAHVKSLETTLETYRFRALADKRYAEYLEKRNRIIIPDEDGSLIEFVIAKAEKYKDREGYKVAVHADASYFEIRKASVIYPNEYTRTLSQHAGFALNNSGWTVGVVESTGTRTLEIESHTNPLDFLKRLAREFDVELRFRVEHNGNRITGRYVDLLERVGEWRGREITFGKDLDGIRRIEKQDIVTALLGLGPEGEDGTRLEVLVEDEDALQRWGRIDEYGELQHLIEPYEIESDRMEMTETEAIQYTRTALDKRINTQVSYEATVVDLEDVPGMDNKKMRFGDSIRIKDTSFIPPLYLEARIYEQERSIKFKAKRNIKLGDFVEYTEEQVHAIWNQLRNEIRKKVDIAQVKEYAEPKKIESDTPPQIKQGENPIWVDTSKSIKVPHVVVADEWVKMSHDEDEISDADRLTHGVVDVGQVPLRTSITGARIEWDGVNGFVQYNSNNEIVTHLNLDGDARFTGIINSSEINASDIIGGDILGAHIEGGSISSNNYHSEPNSGVIDKQIHVENANLRFLSYSTNGNLLDYNVFTFNNLETQSPYTFDIPEAVFTGSLKLENASGPGNALVFPNEHKMYVGASSGDFHVYGNRNDGQRPFVVHSHNNESSGRDDLWVDSSGYVHTANRLYSGHNFYAGNYIYNEGAMAGATTNSPNLHVFTNTGRIAHSTSTIKNKLIVKEITENIYKLLNVVPCDWYDRQDMEEYAEALTKKYEGEEVDFDELDISAIRRVPGLIAEDVERAGLSDFVHYSREGEVEGVMYDRLWTLLIPIVRNLKNRLDVLENGN